MKKILPKGEMKSISTFLFFAVYLSLLPAQQFDQSIVKSESLRYSNSSNLNKINYPGDQTFDVIYYKLNLDLSHTPQHLIGEVTVTAKNLSNDPQSFFLDLSNNMIVDSVILNNIITTYEHEGNTLTIYHNQAILINEILSATVYYHGIPQTSGLGSFVFDPHPSIWTLSQPYGASEWWPCKDSPADKADSADIWITCSSDFYAVSNGTLLELIDNGNGTKTFKWKSSYPIAHYLISLAIADYTIYEQHFVYSEIDSMPVIHYIYPNIFNSVKEQLDKTIPMLEIFSEKFGLYPFINEKYGHASFGRGGMEHQTVSSMGVFTDGVMAHELAHQWFGDKVTCKDWNNIWLNEGFATFCEGVYIETISGKEAYISFIHSQMTRAKTATGSLYVQNINLISEIFNGPRSYSKGAVVLHMLRGIMGDTLFYAGIKNYLDDPELMNSGAVTEDFQSHIENVYGSSLGYFFQQWVYGENYPKYYVRWNYTERENNIFEIDISIEQRDNSYPHFFIMPVQIRIPSTIKDTTITLFNNQQNQTFKFYIEGRPVNFIFDPGRYILHDVFINDPRDLTKPERFKLHQNYPNPFNNTTTIRFETTEREIVTLKLFDILGNEISTLFNEEVAADSYEIEFDASKLSSGIYYYQLWAGEYFSTKKMLMLK